ncbi:DUF3806 domain-containing protein [Cellulomonas sp. NPDC057328]|uniref:DUF3806 domain-containing protein n=1 Tax=Cellulomonas sp. NPDC057328 TaxID=3346101 RepID=UPI0036331A2A
MGLFDRRTPPPGSVLPSPHGPADTPLRAADVAVDEPADPHADDVADDLDDEDDLDDAPITPVWPARPGGPHDDSADDHLPLVPIVPAVLADAREARGGPGADTSVAEAGPVAEAAPVADVAPAVAAAPVVPAPPVVEPPTAVPPVPEPPAPLSPPPVAPAPVAAPTDAPTSAPADRHTVDELNPAERIWLAQQRALLADLCDDPTDAAAVAALFDRVRAQWADAAERPDPRPLADAFGVALGDLVVAHAPALRWAAASDRFGTEIVLAHGTPEVLVYPLASVGQYWEDARPGWFAGQVERLTQTVRAALAAPG